MQFRDRPSALRADRNSPAGGRMFVFRMKNEYLDDYLIKIERRRCFLCKTRK